MQNTGGLVELVEDDDLLPMTAVEEIRRYARNAITLFGHTSDKVPSGILQRRDIY